MPTPNEGESRREFIQRCIPIVLEDKTADDPDQAVAVCSSIWERAMAKKNDIIEDETLVAYGGAVKALGGGRVGGYLVIFTTDEDPDLEGEFFTKDTYFGDPDPVPLYGTVYYNHGLDKKIGKRRLGVAEHRVDDFGVWAEAQLNQRDKYEKFIYQLAEQGKLGWSSGTASHLMEREMTGKAVWIKSWPLGLDDTLTPVPAEPRNSVMPLKSWAPIMPAPSLADRMKWLNVEIKGLYDDLRGLVGNIDRPLSEIKRGELTELLESCSELDAVRTDLQKVLDTAPIPITLVEIKKTSYQLAELRKRFADILKEN